MNVLSFGTAGVRGRFNQDVTLDSFARFVASAVSYKGAKSIVVGWDSRRSSYAVAKLSIGTGLALGSVVHVVGLLPTPVIAYSTSKLHADIGFSVTASHNPPEYSGVKMFDSTGRELMRYDELKIEENIANISDLPNNFDTSLEEGSLTEDYINDVIKRVGYASSKLRVAVDCANGPGSLVTPVILGSMGHDVMVVNGNLSGSFPARNPEPTPTNLRDFSMFVKSVRPDLALAHDGDADRLVLLNRQGRILPHWVLPVLYLTNCKKKGTVVLAENVAYVLEKKVREMGFTVKRSMVGKSFTELGDSGILAVEPSKIVFKEWGPWEDGIYAAAVITSIVSRNPNLLDKTLAETKWQWLERNFRGRVNLESVSKQTEKELARMGLTNVRTIDGVKFVMRDFSSVMVRKSGTEDKIRVYIEANSMNRIKKLMDIATKIIVKNGGIPE